MKVALELKKIETESKQQAEDCEKYAKNLMTSATAVEKLHQTLETQVQTLLDTVTADAAFSDAAEKEYLDARCKREIYVSNVAYKEALEAAAQSESLREAHTTTHGELARVFAAVLGITSDAEKEKLVRAAEAEKMAKFKKKRNVIAIMAKVGNESSILCYHHCCSGFVRMFGRSMCSIHRSRRAVWRISILLTLQCWSCSSIYGR